MKATNSHRFQNVYCSQCGGSFGAGDSGFSHCRDHQRLNEIAEQKTWNVRIEFTDGVWERQAISDSQKQAEHLVLLDARMLTPDHRVFFGKVLSITSQVVA